MLIMMMMPMMMIGWDDYQAADRNTMDGKAKSEIDFNHLQAAHGMGMAKGGGAGKICAS